MNRDHDTMLDALALIDKINGKEKGDPSAAVMQTITKAQDALLKSIPNLWKGPTNKAEADRADEFRRMWIPDVLDELQEGYWPGFRAHLLPAFLYVTAHFESEFQADVKGPGSEIGLLQWTLQTREALRKIFNLQPFSTDPEIQATYATALLADAWSSINAMYDTTTNPPTYIGAPLSASAANEVATGLSLRKWKNKQKYNQLLMLMAFHRCYIKGKYWADKAIADDLMAKRFPSIIWFALESIKGS